MKSKIFIFLAIFLCLAYFQEQIESNEEILSQETKTEDIIYNTEQNFDYQSNTKDEYDTDSLFSNETLTKEWRESMQDFEPSDILSYNIPGNTIEIIGEQIKIVPSYVRGVFFASSFGLKIDFSIKDSYNKTVFDIKDQKEGIFRVNITRIGHYKFVFDNTKNSEQNTIMFGIHTGNSSDINLKKGDLNPLEIKLINLEQRSNILLQEIKFYRRKSESFVERFSIYQTFKRITQIYFFSLLLKLF